MSDATLRPGTTVPQRPVPWVRWIGTVLVVGLVVWSILALDIKWARLLEAPGDLYRVFRLMVERMAWDKFGHLMGLMGDSIAMAWLGTLIAALFAVPLAFLAAENLAPRPVVWAVRLVFNLLRAIPEVVLAILFVPIFGLTEKAGVLAIAVGSIGTLGKLCSEVLEAIQRGPVEAADAVGATGLQRLRWGVLPQALPEITSFVLYRFEINIRASAVLGVIGAGGIGQALSEGLKFKEWGTAGMALVIVIVVTMAIDALSGYVRRRILRGDQRGVTGDHADAVSPAVEAMPLG